MSQLGSLTSDKRRLSDQVCDLIEQLAASRSHSAAAQQLTERAMRNAEQAAAAEVHALSSLQLTKEEAVKERSRLVSAALGAMNELLQKNLKYLKHLA